MDDGADLHERESLAERRIAAAAERVREADALLRAELELRDRAIVEALDAGALSIRRAARAAGLTKTGVHHVMARAG